MNYEFGSEVLRCVASEFGAELISVKYCGKERMWQNENGGWDRHAPVLFPYGGYCNVKKDGVLYPFSRHGVVIDQTFTVAEKTEDKIVFCLRANAETKKYYPYDFSLFVTYMVVGNRLQVTYEAVNEGEEVMYGGFASHESYALDGEVDEFAVEFEKEEKFLSLYALKDDGRMTGESNDFGQGMTFPFPKAYMQDSTVIFANVQSRKVTLKKRGEDKPLVRVSFADFPNILFWHPKDSRMVCIEPWQNLPDDLVGEPQDISKKQGFSAIAPKGSLIARHEIEYF